MDVHEVVHNPGLDMALMFMNQNLLATVENLHKAVIMLHSFIQWFILSLVVLYALSEIFNNLFLY